MPRFYEPDLGANPDSPFARDGSGKLIRRSYWLDMSDRILVMVMVNGIGARLTNDEKRAHLTDLKRDDLIDQVCIQEILPPKNRLVGDRAIRMTVTSRMCAPSRVKGINAVLAPPGGEPPSKRGPPLRGAIASYPPGCCHHLQETRTKDAAPAFRWPPARKPPTSCRGASQGEHCPERWSEPSALCRRPRDMTYRGMYRCWQPRERNGAWWSAQPGLSRNPKPSARQSGRLCGAAEDAAGRVRALAKSTAFSIKFPRP